MKSSFPILRGRLNLLEKTMKVEAVKHLRAKLKAGEPTHGLWVTTEAIATTELAVALGLGSVNSILGAGFQ